MRIGFISMMEGCLWGGSEVLWSQVAERFAQSGAEVVVSIRGWQETRKPIQKLAEAGCRILLRWPKSLVARVATRLGMGREREWAWIPCLHPDLVVISLGIHLEGIEPAAVCRATGVPYVLIIQSADENRWPEDNYLDLLRGMYLGALACYFVSNRNRELLETMLAARLPQALVVRNPFNVRYDASPAWPDNSGGMRFACVAALASVQKGQDLLLHIFSRPEWRNRPVHLSLYGSGHNARSLPALAKMLDLTSVAFRGYASDIERLWSEHHAMILPSRHEGMPLAIVEAMLCGRMCVTTDVAGNAELVEDEVTGFVAPGPSIEMVRDAMERAWNRRAEWREIGAAAAKSVRERVPVDPVGVFVQEIESCLTRGVQR